MTCPLCGASHITTTTENRFVFVSCHDCEADLLIEFDPPDAPGLRARIEHVDIRTESHDGHDHAR